jgi:hypothetical protein
MTPKPYNRSIAAKLLHSISEDMFSPRAACGEVKIAYGDLLSWLDQDVDEFRYAFEKAMAIRVAGLERTYLTSPHRHVQQILLPVLRVANPEAFGDPGEASPIKDKPVTKLPFERTWVDPQEAVSVADMTPEAREAEIAAAPIKGNIIRKLAKFKVAE